MAECKHTKDERSTAQTVQKHIKILHKIITKYTTYIKATDGHLSHSNINFILTMIMRDMNKYNLIGYTKKQLCVCVIENLLDTIGLPHIISHYSAELIEICIERIYSEGLHRYKRAHKWRFWK